MPEHRHWVGTWTAAPAPAEGVTIANQTLRMNPRISVGGNMFRVRLSNAYGTGKLRIGSACIGRRASGAAVVGGSNKQLTFGGHADATIAAGAFLVSDPVDLALPDLADVAISIYLPETVAAGFQVTGRYARQTNYLSPLGNFAASEAMPVGKLVDDWYVLSGVDVVSDDTTGGIVCIGDSLTDGNISTHDAYCRWPDQLARRLMARPAGRRMAVMNQGLGGNRILHDQRGSSGLRRFDRDVLAAPGVTHAIICLGINDIRNRLGRPDENVTADQMIAGLKQLALRARTRGIAFFGGTLPPFENETFFPGAWTPHGEAKRQAVNEWIRTGNAFDAVVDFDAGVRDPAHPTRMLPVYDCGDHLHQSDVGYNRMGDIIDLSLFD